MKNIILPEIVSVGIYNAQLAIKNRSVSKNRKTTMFELELPIEDGGISYIDNTSKPITKDLVICAKPGQIRHTRLPFKCYYIHMIVNDGRLLDMLSSLPNYMELEDTRDIRDIFIGICENLVKSTDYAIFSDAFTFLILIVILCVKPTGIFGEKNIDKV